MWFALFQDIGMEGDPPSWGLAAVLVSRLLVDLVAAWFAVTLLRLAIVLGRFGWCRLRPAHTSEEG